MKEKVQVTYKGKPVRITPNFSVETMKARRSWVDVLQTLKDTIQDYYTQQRFHSPLMAKTDVNNMYPQTLTENSKRKTPTQGS